MFHLLRHCLLCLICVLPLLAQAAEATRPRIGLVLGGGGARGAAHVGVLEVLEALHVPVDCVAGTSMGALVAGAWAAGISPAEMRAALDGADWDDLFQDNPDYAELAHRNKTMLRRFLPGSEIGVGTGGARYQPGVVAGQKIKLFLNQLVGARYGEPDIEHLKLPLSIIATDIGHGERVVFREGSLTAAMRASMSVPGLLAPVEHQGRKLVDGGLVDNLPISEVRERCQADVVIAVNVGSPRLKVEEVGSLLTVSAQMVNILTEQNVARSLASLHPTDILLRPELEGVRSTDFGRYETAMASGKAAAQAAQAQLAALGVPAEAYAAWRSSLRVQPAVAPRVDAVEIVGLKRVPVAAVDRHLEVESGSPLDLATLNRDVLRIYGDGHYERVDYSLLTQRERTVLRVMPVEKSWGPDYVRFGLNLQADTSQGSGFGLRAAYHRTWLNTLGGELLVTGDVGTTSRLGANFYQPLDAGQRFFAETTIGVEHSPYNLYQGDRRIAQYTMRDRGASVYLGANIGLLGPVRLGWVERRRDFDVSVGQAFLPRASIDLSGWRASLEFDQMDRLYFPTRGWAAQLSWFNAAHLGYSRLDADLRASTRVAGNVFSGRLRYTGSPRGTLPAFDAGQLGGFQNMTAFAPGQLLADEVRYVGVRGERILGQAPLGLRGDLRIGLTAEFAQLQGRYAETGRRSLVDSTAVYIGGETPFGPAYLGFGYSSSGASNLFLFVGTP